MGSSLSLSGSGAKFTQPMDQFLVDPCTKLLRRSIIFLQLVYWIVRTLTVFDPHCNIIWQRMRSGRLRALAVLLWGKKRISSIHKSESLMLSLSWNQSAFLQVPPPSYERKGVRSLTTNNTREERQTDTFPMPVCKKDRRVIRNE